MKTISRVLFAAATLQCIVSIQHQHLGQVHCSSYLDDYFLPTAKLALNKIQQSLSPQAQANLSSAQADSNNKTAAGDYIQPLTTVDSNSANDDKNRFNNRLNKLEEPNKNEFVKLETTSADILSSNVAADGTALTPNSVANQLATSSGDSNAPKSISLDDSSASSSTSGLTVLSSTSATDYDPTSTVASSNADTLAESSTFSGAEDNRKVVEDSAGATKTTDDRTQQQPSQSSSASPLPGSPSAYDPPLMSTTTSEPSSVVSSTSVGEQSPGAAAAKPTTSINAAPAVTTTPAVESKSAEEAVKETEMEAVAAVDASIGFGADLFAATTDSCYDEYGNAHYCEPEFENVAFEKQVEVSSECGNPPSRFCTAYLNERNDQIRNCHICDAQHPKKRHPAAYLTDMNNSNNPTCWVSAPINSNALPSTTTTTTNNSSINSPINAAAAVVADQPLRSDNVTLVLNLDKKYEIIYISMQFCSMKPDSLAIFKSMDFGHSWLPYQFYSSQCRRMYGRQSRAAASSLSSSTAQTSGLRASSSGEPALEPNCVNSSSSTSGANSGRIAFSTLGVGGHSGGSQSVQDWITATNIKIVLDRHQASWMHSNLVNPHAHAHHHGPQQGGKRSDAATTSGGGNSTTQNESAASQQQQSGQQQQEISSESSLTSPSDTFNYAMSDLTVGGRCKCNGHASRCIHGKDGRLQCDCRHNTAGRDCEKCAPFHFDRPWARATQLDANPCQPCNCNGHSRKCRFDNELYRLSGKRSGGVCIGCKDNTAGRYCHYCKEGFTRDHSKPMSDKEACKLCDCHPIGAKGKFCDQTTGQCPCKEGVAGLQCNRCAPGYQQSSSLSEPCIKLPENDINYEPSLTVDGDEQSASTSSDQQQQQNPPANEPSTAVIDNLAESHAQSRAPSGGSRFNNKNKIDISPDNSNDQDNGLQDQDKDDQDSDAAQEQQVDSLGALERKHRIQQEAHWQSTHQTRPTNHYIQRNRQQQQFEEQPLDYDIGPVPRLRNTLQQPPQASPHYNDEYPTMYLPPAYNTYNTKERFAAAAGYRSSGGHRGSGRSNGRVRPNDILMQPIANIEHGADELNSLDEAPPNQNNYALNSMYNEDNFNQIQVTRQRQPLAGGRNRQQQSILAANGRRRFDSNEQPPVAVQSEPPVVSCGDCQSGTRRFGFKQFCHLEYAIKATILSKFMAEDWTKFDVEIQDIFKSSTSGAILSGRGIGGGSYLDNMVQSDESESFANQRALFNVAQQQQNRNSTTVVGVDSSVEQPLQPASHRIKVGTIQTIWVPTEDITCKCPKLKLRSTYLLMGSIDAKENSANSLQLDRHGIALEWKSSLQDKLVKYQRRHSRGRC